MLFFLYRKCQYSNAKETNELFSVERTNLIANRRSRHLYDLERMMDKPFALKAVHNDDLWEHIRQHRMAFTAMLGVDYTDNMRAHLCLTPPEQWRNEWKEDYERMCQTMINGEKLPFEKRTFLQYCLTFSSFHHKLLKSL